MRFLKNKSVNYLKLGKKYIFFPVWLHDTEEYAWLEEIYYVTVDLIICGESVTSYFSNLESAAQYSVHVREYVKPIMFENAVLSYPPELETDYP